MASSTLTTPKPGLERLPESSDPRLGGPGGGNGSGRGGDGGGPREPDPAAMAVQRYKLGVWVGFGGIIMVFAAFTSAMVVRSGMGEDWKSFGWPAVLWFGTALLLVSSFTIEKAKRALRASAEDDLKKWLTVTAVLGVAFLASQWAGWMDLVDRGLYMAANPSHSFFYVFTVAHGLHLFGGLIAVGYVTACVWRGRLWATREAVVEAAALYWHFMDALWVYLFVLLLVWR